MNLDFRCLALKIASGGWQEAISKLRGHLSRPCEVPSCYPPSPSLRGSFLLSPLPVVARSLP